VRTPKQRVTRVDAILSATLERIDAVRAELERLSTKAFPRPIARKLLELFAKRLPPIKSSVSKRYKSARVEGWSWQQLSREVRALTSPLRVIHPLLQYFDHTDSSRVPFEILDAFQTLAFEYTQSRVEFILKPDRSYEYSTIDLKSYIAYFSQGLQAQETDFPAVRIVCFPSAEAGSTLLHTNLFHEIGHCYYETKVDSEAVYKLVAEALRPQFTATPASNGSSPSGEDQVKANSFLTLWFEELFCDCFAFRTAGPAFASAYLWYSEPIVAETSTETHPDANVRMYVLKRYIDRMKSELPEMNALCAQFGDHHLPATESNHRTGATSHDLARAALLSETFLEGLFKLVDGTGTSPFAQAGFANKVKEATLGISNLIPPGATEPPLTRCSDLLALVFNAGWLFRLTAMKEWKAFGWDERRSADALNQVLLAAIEGGELVARHRSQHGG
jgi:hypothetical protein